MKISLKSIKNGIHSSKLTAKYEATVRDLRKRFSDKIITIFFVNALLIAFQLFYLNFRYEFVNDLVPFWYTRVWGDLQFGRKQFLYFLPVISSLITIGGLSLVVPLKRYYVRHSLSLIAIFTISANLLLTYSLLRIIFIASVPFAPIVNPLYVEVAFPALIALIATQFILPVFIRFAQENDIVTNPVLHEHPGMLLSEPSARGGGFIYGILFIVGAAIFVGFPSYLIPFYTALFLISLLGFVDDYQNTHPETKLRFLENPFVRLLMLFFIVSIVSTLGTRFFSISVPLGGAIAFDSGIISAIITTFWIVWVLNVLSWSNGIDGQYAGIVSVASILLILLALRFDVILVEHKQVAMLAAVSAGLSLGFIRFTWHPSTILWGFGAMSAGLVLSVLSILISSKILTSIIIILIPFLDAVVTVLRRILQGKNPLKGDKGHLHHLLLARGWSIRRIAVSYWLGTAFFGLIGYLSAERFTVQIGLFMAGIMAFIIILLNLKLRTEIIAPKNPLPESYK